MKEKFTKSIKQKIFIIPMMIVMLFNFVFPNYSQASIFDGGVLLSPVLTIGAAIFDALNSILYTIVVTEGDESQIAAFVGIGEYDVYITDADDQAEYLEEHAASGDADYTIDTSKIVLGYGIPNIRLTPAEIFSNSIPMLNANFFSDDLSSSRSVVGALKNTIASWYNSLRLISLAGLLAVLAYIGIRVMLSSTATDKAKYKERAKDWFIAMCLVFILHYIMVFIMTSVDEITSVLSGANSLSSEEDTTETTQEVAEQIVVEVTDGGSTDVIGGQNVKFYTNLTGYMRLMIEHTEPTPKVSAFLMYAILTGFTVYYVVIYFKRLLTIIFLTLIAPLVALTYPLDKLKDGKAQAFNFWLREYIMNALLPIIHLLLYTVLVTSAADLIKKVPLYAVVAVGFIISAEKIVKEMFGFKSSTAPSSGFAQGMMANQLLQGAKGGNGKKSEGEAGQDKVKTYGDKGKIDSGYSDLAIGDGNNQNDQSNNEGGTSPRAYSQEEDEEDDLPLATYGTDGGDYDDDERHEEDEEDDLPLATYGTDGGDYDDADNTGTAGVTDDTNNGDRANWNFREGIAEATDRGASEAFPRAKAIKNNAKKMIQKRYRAAGGGKGIIIKGAKKLGRAYVRGGAMLIGAAVGLAGAAMTGNPDNMLKGLTGGIAAGNVAGKRWNNKISERSIISI